MKFFLVICFVVNLLTTSLAYSFELPQFLTEPFEALITKTSTINTYEKLCHEKLNLNNNAIDKQWKNICNVVKKSDLCKDIANEDKITCNESPNANEIDFTSMNFIQSCGKGLLNSLKEFFEFLEHALVWLWKMGTDGDKRSEAFQKTGKTYNMAMNYILTEFTKEKMKPKYKKMVVFPDSRAALESSKNIIKTVFSAIGDVVSNEFYGLGCLNKEKRAEKSCKIFGDFFMPPLFVFSVLKFGPKLLKTTARFKKYFSKKAKAAKKAMQKLAYKPISKNISLTDINRVKSHPVYLDVVGKLDQTDQPFAYELIALLEKKYPKKSKKEILDSFKKETSTCSIK